MCGLVFRYKSYHNNATPELPATKRKYLSKSYHILHIFSKNRVQNLPFSFPFNSSYVHHLSIFSGSYGLPVRASIQAGSYYASEISFLASPFPNLSIYRGSYVFYLALFSLFYSPDLLHIRIYCFFFFFQSRTQWFQSLLWLLQWKRESGGTSVRP